jgi:hypothetical protein
VTESCPGARVFSPRSRFHARSMPNKPPFQLFFSLRVDTMISALKASAKSDGLG